MRHRMAVPRLATGRAALRGAAVIPAIAVATLGAAAVLAQAQRPLFRADARIVPVYATVVDAAGRFVLDLTADDFEIRDNGRVQPITQFITDTQPLSAAVVLDGSGSMSPSFQTVLDGAEAFVLRLQPGDAACIGSFADRFAFSPGLTADRDVLLAWLREPSHFHVGKGTRLWDGLDAGIDALASADTRRVIVVFTDGYDTTSFTSPAAVRARASQAHVMVFALAMWTGSGRTRRRPNSDLEALARSTGGGFYEIADDDDMNATFTRAALELHNQYLLGFTPQVLDGREHTLDVRVKRPGLTVRARKSYVAPGTR